MRGLDEAGTKQKHSAKKETKNRAARNNRKAEPTALSLSLFEAHSLWASQLISKADGVVSAVANASLVSAIISSIIKDLYSIILEVNKHPY